MLHSNSNLNPNLSTSSNSVFTRWNSTRNVLPPLIPEGTDKISQHLLKKVLIDIPNLHCSSKDGNLEKSKDSEAGGCGESLKKSASVQDELSANHVLAERRRREKLNERFSILRSLVPFVTKVHTSIVYSFFCHFYTYCGSTV
jgi:Helix-loop-helix DNA-binding domain